MKAIDIMNTNKIVLYICAVLLAVSACDEKDNLDPLGNWDMTAPVLTAPAADAHFVLDETAPDAEYVFEWDPATTSNRFGISYRLLLVPRGTEDLSSPILTVSDDGGSATVTAADLDYALWAACYPAGAEAELDWVVVAEAVGREEAARRPIGLTRFETEREIESLFISGSGSEAGPDASNAMPMRTVPDTDGNASGVYEIYTTLTQGETFVFRDRANAHSRVIGGEEGVLEPCASPIVAPESGVYRITADVVSNTYSLLKIDRWSLVGGPLPGGWDGDVPLTYQGAGVWSGNIEFLSDAGFVFRANGDWAYLLKRVAGTATGDDKGGELIMESEAGDRGIEVEDVPGYAGLHTVTLNLNAGSTYSYTLVPISQEPAAAVIGETGSPDGDKVSGSFDIESMDAPEALYLISGGDVVELVRSGDVFATENYVALQASKTYTLNTASDGSGEEVVAGEIGVARDQAYKLTVDFSTGKLQWTYYNIKLFHWDEVGGGWDQRQELLMTYIHPYTFEVTGTLTGGFHSKFNSPWDVQFGTDSKSLTGTMENGGANFTGIVQSGQYVARIVVSPDYSTAEYSFVRQQ